MAKPLVSIIINTYNHKDYISQAIESALMQETAFPFEIIIGEDESNDGTREICVDYAGKYPNKIRLFLRSRKDVIYINGCPTGRYNFIENVKSSKGKYVALLPGDDYWTDPLKLQKQVDFLEQNSDFALVFSNLKVVNQDGKFISDAYVDAESPRSFQVFHKPPEEFDIIHLSKGNIIHTPGVLFRNWMLNENLPDYMYHVPIGDWPLHMFTARLGKIKYQDTITAAYRITDSGVFSSSSKLRRMEMSLLQYPYMIQENIFNDKIIEYWMNILPERIIKYLGSSGNIADAERKRFLIKVYSEKVPELVTDLLIDTMKERDSMKTVLDLYYQSSTYKVIKRITKMRSYLVAK